MTMTRISDSKQRAPRLETSDPRQPRVHETWAVGDVAHQGDLLFVGLDRLPQGARPRASRQLADGTTPGSRHVLNGGTCYEADPADIATLIQEVVGVTIDPAFLGPMFIGPCTVTHPQHQHQVFLGGVPTVVVYQRNLDIWERVIRARD